MAHSGHASDYAADTELTDRRRHGGLLTSWVAEVKVRRDRNKTRRPRKKKRLQKYHVRRRTSNIQKMVDRFAVSIFDMHSTVPCCITLLVCAHRYYRVPE